MMKKLSKKQVLLMGAAVVLFILILFLVWFFRGTRISRPEDTDLKFWITESVEASDFEGYAELFGVFGAHIYLDEAYHFLTEDGEQRYPPHYVSYTVSAYPDYAFGTSTVTRITITDPDVRVYGLTVDSEWEEVNGVMRSHGYRMDGDGYTRLGVRFVFRDGYIQISVESRNMFGIQY